MQDAQIMHALDEKFGKPKLSSKALGRKAVDAEHFSSGILTEPSRLLEVDVDF